MMIVISISDLRYVDPAHIMIDMMVTFDNNETHPFTYHPDDPYGAAPQVRALLEGGGYTIAAYVKPIEVSKKTLDFGKSIAEMLGEA